MRNGEIICVDIEKGMIQVENEDFEERCRGVAPYTKNHAKEYLHVYAKLVHSAAKGAIIPTRE